MEVANRNECEENPTDRPANMHTTTYQFCIIYRKKNKKDTGKLQKGRQSLCQHNIELKTKEGAQTKHKNSKTSRRNQSNKKVQRKQQHCFPSQKRYRHGKNTGKAPNMSKKHISTKTNFETSHKTPKGHYRDKTTHPRPVVHSTTSLTTNKKIETENFKMKKCDPGIG